MTTDKAAPPIARLVALLKRLPAEEHPHAAVVFRAGSEALLDLVGLLDLLQHAPAGSEPSDLSDDISGEAVREQIPELRRRALALASDLGMIGIMYLLGQGNREGNE